MYLLVAAWLPSDFCSGQFSARYTIIELHCLATVFDGQAILSSDYFVH